MYTLGKVWLGFYPGLAAGVPGCRSSQMIHLAVLLTTFWKVSLRLEEKCIKSRCKFTKDALRIWSPNQLPALFSLNLHEHVIYMSIDQILCYSKSHEKTKSTMNYYCNTKCSVCSKSLICSLLLCAIEPLFFLKLSIPQCPAAVTHRCTKCVLIHGLGAECHR